MARRQPEVVVKPLERIADEMWPGAPIVPEMETGASDSIYTMAAGRLTGEVQRAEATQEVLMRQMTKDKR